MKEEEDSLARQYLERKRSHSGPIPPGDDFVVDRIKSLKDTNWGYESRGQHCSLVLCVGKLGETGNVDTHCGRRIKHFTGGK
jgi:hypothetical protein